MSDSLNGYMGTRSARRFNAPISRLKVLAPRPPGLRVKRKITKRTHLAGHRRFQDFRSQIVRERRSQTAATAFYQTNPCARRASSKFRVPGSKLSEIAKRSQLAILDRHNYKPLKINDLCNFFNHLTYLTNSAAPGTA
jgi:hypothetical protein